MHLTSIESLESRIAPATLLPGGKTVTFTDTDGDLVKVNFSMPILTAANVANLFAFENAFGDSGPQHLVTLDLFSLPASANGINITVTAKRSPAGGNGEVDIGAINGSNIDPTTGLGLGIDLGKVRVQGSLNFIDAGDGDLDTMALKSLDVIRLGAELPGVPSDIHGSIDVLKVRDTMQGRVHLASSVQTSFSQLSIGSVIIGGSLVGGALDHSGTIEASQIGKVRIGGNIIGGTGDDTGRIITNTLGQLTVGSGIFGGSGKNSARFVVGFAESILVRGSVVGGSGEASAALSASSIESVKIGGDLIGGAGGFSGQVRPNGLAKVFVGGNVVGGTGVSSGGIGANDMQSVVVRGSVLGGDGQGSGSISANQIEVVRIGGDLVGGGGDGSGTVFGGGHLRAIGGSILGRVPDSGNAAVGAGLYATIFDIDIITVGRDVIAANIAVGVSAGADNQFGTADDLGGGQNHTAGIQLLAIKGHVAGPVGNISFGIEANQIDQLRVGGVAFKDGTVGLDFATGFLIDPQGTVKVRVVA